MEKFMAEYTAMKKENTELLEKLEKKERQHQIALSAEKAKSEKSSEKTEVLVKHLREVKSQLSSNQSKLTSKEVACSDLLSRIDTKSIIELKIKDRDSNIFIKFLGQSSPPPPFSRLTLLSLAGRKPISNNSAD